MGDLDDDGPQGDPLWVSATLLPELIKGAPVEFTITLFDLISIFGMQQGGTFRYDPVALAEALKPAYAQRPDKPPSAKVMEKLKPHLRKAFVELPDGRWALNPEVFAVNDPIAEEPGA